MVLVVVVVVYHTKTDSLFVSFKTGNGISRSEHGGIQRRIGMAQAGSWQYTAPNGEVS